MHRVQLVCLPRPDSILYEADHLVFSHESIGELTIAHTDDLDRLHNGIREISVKSSGYRPPFGIGLLRKRPLKIGHDNLLPVACGVICKQEKKITDGVHHSPWKQ